MSTSGPSTGEPAPPIDDALTFGVLGPLEVHAGSHVCEVAGRQERALLALLLTAPGRVFSVPAIVTGLWGEDPPSAAEKTVRSYVSRLRRSLPESGAPVVITRSPGYLAAVHPESVDVHRFRAMVASGRRELAAARHADAAATLRGALALWRGDAYAEFEAPFAVGERTALEELRLTVVEDRVEAELGAGGGSQLVGELEALLARNPWRERLWGQLMTALYRAGRQGDALLAFQRARSSLVADLGVEPGPGLQAVEAMVLAHDPRLSPPDRESEQQLALPAAGHPMIGREAELARLLAAYERAAAGAVVRLVLTGPHGIGKTRLMTELGRAAQAKGARVLGGVPAPNVGGARVVRSGTTVVTLLDDLQQVTATDRTAMRDHLAAASPPLLVVGACATLPVTEADDAVLAEIFPERLAIPPLSTAQIEEVVRPYVPPDAVADAVTAVAAAAGVPLQVHAAACRFGEQRAAAAIRAAAAGIAEPRRGLDASREQVVDGVLDLQRVRLGAAVRQAGDRRAVRCPYKGLAFFGVEDAPYFFGRERLVARLVARLVDAPLLAVVGASGSGKSSILRAGLVAAVVAGTLPGSERWHTVLTTPARQPVELPTDRIRTLLVVDQFEEVFTALSGARRDEYARWLAAAAASDDVTVVVGVRSDYYGDVSALPELAELLAANTVLVGAMSPAELTQVVELPAAAAGLELETGLAALVTGDVAGEPGGLPLLSTALLSLWERREGNRLSLAAYHELGGVRSAVAQLGERTYARLTAAQQGVARRILLRLVDASEGGEPVRRRVSLAELAAATDPDARVVIDALAAGRLLTVSDTHAEVAHEALLREWPRLRGWFDEDATGRRLRRHLVPAAAYWDGAGRDASELYRGHRLAAALDWLRDHPDDLTGQELDFLHASRKAAEAEATRRRRSIRRLRGLSVGLACVLALAVVAGWVAVDQRQEATGLAADAAGSALEADVRALRAAALGEPRLDLALLLAAQAYRFDPSNESRATLLQVAQRSPEAQAVFNTEERLQSVATSDDGRVLAAIGSGGTAYVWDTGSGDRVATVPGVSIFGGTSLDVSPDGQVLAIVGIPVAADPERQVVEGHVVVVDLSAQRPRIRSLPGPALSAARFAADGRTLVTLTVDGRIRYVDARTGESQPRPGPGIPAPRTAVLIETTDLDGPANRHYLVAADTQDAGRLTVFEAASGRVLWSHHQGRGTVAAVSPDGSAVVLGQADGRVERVFLGAEGGRARVSSDLAEGLVDVAWSPDGDTFAGATPDGAVTVWAARTLKPVKVLRGHTGSVTQLHYSPDGSSLFASGDDRSVLAWDLTGSRGIVQDVGASLPTGSYASMLSADGSLVASFHFERSLFRLFDVASGTSAAVEIPPRGGPAGSSLDPRGRFLDYLAAGWPNAATATVRVVDVARSRLLPYTLRLTPHRGFDAAFSGDGQWLLTADDRRVVLRDVGTGRPAGTAAPYRAQDAVAWAAVDAHGRTAALNLVGGRVEVADLATGQRVALLDPAPALGGVGQGFQPIAFSPDGRWLAAGSEGGRVAAWDTQSWQLVNTWVAVQGGAVGSLAFDPQSRLLVTGGGGTASVWDLAQGGHGGATLDIDPVRSGAEVSVGTQDGGDTLVTYTAGTGVQLWSIAPDELLAHACSVAGRNLTREEWAAALAHRPYQQTCPEQPTA